jgi:hypothetical protein
MSIDFEMELKYKCVYSRSYLAEDVIQFLAVVEVTMKYRGPQKA